MARPVRGASGIKAGQVLLSRDGQDEGGCDEWEALQQLVRTEAQVGRPARKPFWTPQWPAASRSSPARLLDELRRVLADPKLQPVIGDADELIELLALAAIAVTPTETVELVRDPDDNRLIEAAQAGQADVIVTGDQDLLTLRRLEQIEILTPREFLDALQPDV